MLKSKTKKIMAAAAGMLLLCSVAAAEPPGCRLLRKPAVMRRYRRTLKILQAQPGPPVCSVPTALRKLTLQ